MSIARQSKSLKTVRKKGSQSILTHSVAITESTIQIRSNCIVGYQQIADYGNYSPKNKFKLLLQLQAAREKKYSGQLRPGTKKRLAKAIDLLIQSATLRTFYDPHSMKTIKHRLSYITLTVSNSTNITARSAYDLLLVHFLQWLRRTMKVSTYVWKAEIQKRGQIHYHITTPSYIPWQKIKEKWNSLQAGAGLLEDYYKKTGHYEPNSTDIHEVKNIRNLSSYLIKEFCKSIQNPDTIGKVWDCSVNLKKFKRFSIPESSDIYLRLQDMIQKGYVYIKKLDQCWIMELPNNDFTQILSIDKIRLYDEFLQLIRNYKKEK